MEDWKNENLELDTEIAIEAIGGSEELYCMLLKQVIRRIPENIQSMDKKLMEDCDLHSFAIIVHGLKGSLRQIGHHRLASLSDMLETGAKDGDLTFCHERYGELKDDLLYFYEQAESLLQDSQDRTKTGVDVCNISVYFDELKRAKTAADEYDTLTAMGIISQLVNKHFDEQTDMLLSSAMNELEAFQPLSALMHIEKLINLCGEAQPQPEPKDIMTKILVVDDNHANLTLINGILSEHGFKVYPVDSGQTALRFLAKQRPDLILLDMEMPDMSGEEVFTAITSNPEHIGIPVIFLTGNSDFESEVKAFRIGASDYIRKPVYDVILLARVRMQLELSEYRKNKI